jgi:hypothetical protein
MIDEVVGIAPERPIAAGRVGVERAARLPREVRRLLHRLDREVLSGLDDDLPLTTDPGNQRWPIVVEMASAGLAFFAATPRAASQRLWPTALGLTRVAGGVLQ